MPEKIAMVGARAASYRDRIKTARIYDVAKPHGPTGFGGGVTARTFFLPLHHVVAHIVEAAARRERLSHFRR